MTASTISVGDKVLVGHGTTVHEVKALRQELDAAGEPYVMATVQTDSSREGSLVETSRLRKVAKR